MESKYRILYAEDDKRTASVTKEILETEGLYVEIAYNGKQAWEIFQTMKPDLLLLDLELPGKSGLDLVLLVRDTVHIIV